MPVLETTSKEATTFATASTRLKFITVIALVLAINVEILAAGFMKASDGFKNVIHTLAAFVFCALTTGFTILLLSVVELSIGWAVFTALELTGTILVGVFYFGESFSIAKIVGLSISVFGVIILAVAEAEEWSPWPESWNERIIIRAQVNDDDDQ